MATPKKNYAAVKLKGVHDSLWVTLDPAQPMDQLQAELFKLFTRMKHLAGNARVVIDAGTEADHTSLIETLRQYLISHFSVASVSAPEEKTTVTPLVQKPPDMRSWFHRRSDALIVSGRVRSGQKLNCRNHLIILGDVNPGGEVSAGGDILVLGSLGGLALAGQEGNESAIILSLDFRPTQIQIAGVVAAGLPPGSQKTPEYAHIEDGQIVVSPYLQDNPFGKLPWLQLR